jgi:DNA-binding transcriptional LysR family regulator
MPLAPARTGTMIFQRRADMTDRATPDAASDTRRIHGDVDVRVAVSERLVDFVSDGIDIAIRCGGGQYPGLSAELLMKEDHFPVCSPKLLKGRYPLRTPADLARHTLLHDVFTIDWAIWAAQRRDR